MRMIVQYRLPPMTCRVQPGTFDKVYRPFDKQHRYQRCGPPVAAKARSRLHVPRCPTFAPCPIDALRCTRHIGWAACDHNYPRRLCDVYLVPSPCTTPRSAARLAGYISASCLPGHAHRLEGLPSLPCIQVHRRTYYPCPFLVRCMYIAKAYLPCHLQVRLVWNRSDASYSHFSSSSFCMTCLRRLAISCGFSCSYSSSNVLLCLPPICAPDVKYVLASSRWYVSSCSGVLSPSCCEGTNIAFGAAIPNVDAPSK